MAKLTIMRRPDGARVGDERGRRWRHHFQNLDRAFDRAPKVKRYLDWKTPELTGKEPEVEEYVDEYTTRGELEANRLIHRNKIRADEY